MPETDETKKVTEALYQQNLELSVKNKTLSLLEKLYQTSILKSLPRETAQVITNTIREDLNLEFAGIFNFKKNLDQLSPLGFAKSDRLIETLHKIGFMFMDIKINNVSKNNFLKGVAYDGKWSMTDKLEEIWGDSIKQEDINKIKEESHIKTMILYPLLTGTEVLQVLILGLNREYDTLNSFEKSSTSSFTNIIALSINKAYLYKNLQDANVSLENLIKERESLVHLITHKVKASFTHSKYIFAGMLDGTFGAITPELLKMARNGLDSDNAGIETVDLVLNAANLTKGTVRYDMKKVDLKEIVLKTLTDKKIPIDAKGLQLETEIKDGNYDITGDPMWLREVFNNLVENAIRYTRAGKINVGLEKKDDKIIFSVRDTGIGITDEDKKNLFTEGGRGKESVKVNVDSTGYGLYTVKLIVEAHKGRVSVESESGKGSIFSVELPVA